MIRIKIFKNAVQTHGADFTSLLEAQAWIDENVASNSWGKPERWVKQSDVTEQGETLAESTAFEERETELGTAIFFKFPAQYTVETSDITSQVETQDAIQESKEAVELGAELVALIRYFNQAKLDAGTMTDAQFIAFLQDATAAQIERALWTGTFKTAKPMILAYPSFYTADEKAQIIAKIDAFLVKWGRV